MKKLKIAIIGAGAVGLYLAWKLSERGHQILVFEKREKIGKECCSGLFSDRILEFIPQAKKLIEAEFNTCLIYFPKKTIKINLKRKVFFIEHFKLDNLVAKLARSAGSEIILNQEVNELPEGYDRIIGCDGPLSFVRRKLNLPNPKFYLGIQKFEDSPTDVSRETSEDNFPRESAEAASSEDGVSNGLPATPISVNQHEMERSCTKGLAVLETWTIQDGFLWKIPKGDTLEYGIMAPKETLRDPTGQAPPLKAENIFQEFLKKEGVKPTNLKSALIPQGLIIPKNPRITLCGDATGLTKPWSGGGVIWGLTAADILLKHSPNFLAYRKEARKFFLPQIIFSKIAKNLVYFLGFHFPWLLPKKVRVDNDFLFG